MDRTTQIGIGIGVFVFVILMIFMFVPMGDCQTDRNKYSQFEGGGSTWLKSCKACPGLLGCIDLKPWQASSCGISCKLTQAAGEIVEAIGTRVDSAMCTAAITAARDARCCSSTTNPIGECDACGGGGGCRVLCSAVTAACGN